MLGLLLQIAMIYWFNFVHKSGPTWKDGIAVYYVLHQERIVTWLGVQMREHVPFWLTKLSRRHAGHRGDGARSLVLTPVFWRWTRPLRGRAAGRPARQHRGDGEPRDLLGGDDRLRPVPARHRPVEAVGAAGAAQAAARPPVFYDVDCGVCFLIARVLARLDVHRRLRLVSNRDRRRCPPTSIAELLDQTLLVVDPERPSRRWTRADACAEILRALPLGGLWSWPLRLPGLSALAGGVYDAFARNRTRISTWFGLAACGVPGAPPCPTPERAGDAAARLDAGASVRRASSASR